MGANAGITAVAFRASEPLTRPTTSSKTVASSVFSFEKIVLGSDLDIVIQGDNGLGSQGNQCNRHRDQANMAQDIADSGISIESGGIVTIGRDDGTLNTVSANGTGGTLQIRGQGITNKGKLEAKGTDGRLILAYETGFFNFGTLDYNQKIEMTRPQITGVLDANEVIRSAMACGRRRFHDRMVQVRRDQWYHGIFRLRRIHGNFAATRATCPLSPRPVNSEMRSSSARTNGSRPMPLPIPWA